MSIPKSATIPANKASRDVDAALPGGRFPVGRAFAARRLTLPSPASRDPDDVVRTAARSIGANPNLIHIETGLA
jgi:hypothetical protein